HLVGAQQAAPRAGLRTRPRWWRFLPLLALALPALALITVIFGSRAFASYPAQTPGDQGYGPAHDFMVAQRGAPANPDPKSSNHPPAGATAAQAYVTYTYDLIKNARVDQITTTCALTSTVTGDLTTFDAVLQNEVCNGPTACIFRGVTIQPGSFAYAAGALVNC